MCIWTQWNLSIVDTLGTEDQFVTKRFTLIRGYFMQIAMISGPTKAVCYGEVSTIWGVCYQRFCCVCMYNVRMCSSGS